MLEWCLRDMRFHVVGVAQLVRAPDCGSGGRGFESHHPPQLFINAGNPAFCTMRP